MRHLNEVKEKYPKHFIEALFISLLLLYASMVCLVHAFIPGLFKNTASTIMRKLLQRTDSRYAR